MSGHNRSKRSQEEISRRMSNGKSAVDHRTYISDELERTEEPMEINAFDPRRTSGMESGTSTFDGFNSEHSNTSGASNRRHRTDVTSNSHDRDGRLAGSLAGVPRSEPGVSSDMDRDRRPIALSYAGVVASGPGVGPDVNLNIGPITSKSDDKFGRETGNKGSSSRPRQDERDTGSSRPRQDERDTGSNRPRQDERDTGSNRPRQDERDTGSSRARQDERDTDHGRPLGIPNIGSTCYANSVFQALAQTPGLLDELKNDIKLPKAAEMLRDLLREVVSSELSAVNQKKVYRLMSYVVSRDSSFRIGFQNDCHSFLLSLFNTIKSESTGDHHAMEIFEGSLCNAFTYSTCGDQEESDEQMFNSLQIPINTTDLEWSIDKGLDVLIGEEKFGESILPCRTCETKGTHRLSTVTTKKMITKKLPKILILHLARFREVEDYSRYNYYGNCSRSDRNNGRSGSDSFANDMQSSGHRERKQDCYKPTKRLEKISSNVDFEEMLDVRKMLPENESTSFGFYQLYAVLSHTGSLCGGHYYATVRWKDTSNWFYCSDSWVDARSVQRCEKPYKDKNAYVLFYQKIEQNSKQ